MRTEPQRVERRRHITVELDRDVPPDRMVQMRYHHRPHGPFRETRLLLPAIALLLASATASCDGKPAATQSLPAGAHTPGAGTEEPTGISGEQIHERAEPDEAGGETDIETTAPPDRVTDLRVTGATDASITLSFTEVDDGTGSPALYHVRYAPAAENRTWGTAIRVTGGECAHPVRGSEIGATLSCTIAGLDAATEYGFQLVAFRRDSTEAPVAGELSNVPSGRTEAAEPPPPGGGLWIAAAELAELPTSGPAWDNVRNAANRSCGPVDLSDKDSDGDVCVLAKALVYARTGQAVYLTDVLAGLASLVDVDTYDGRALALGRNLAAYVIAADLVALEVQAPLLDEALRGRLRELLAADTYGATDDLVHCHEKRPNNWGTHCGASRAAIAVYLDDAEELARTARVFKGYLGDRSSYAGFTFGGPYGERDHSWECDAQRPVGINPAGCARDGHSIDGVIPDDQRRGGSFAWPPPKENYVWEALQGALVQAVILHRAGYRPFEWEDRALLRAVRWLHDEADFPAEGDDEWQPHLVNHFYGTSFPAPVPARHGKNVGWTDWTHRRTEEQGVTRASEPKAACCRRVAATRGCDGFLSHRLCPERPEHPETPPARLARMSPRQGLDLLGSPRSTDDRRSLTPDNTRPGTP